MRLIKFSLNFQLVLVDSQEAPLLQDEVLPEGVESVVQVTEEQAEAGRGLLFQQVSSNETFLALGGKKEKMKCRACRYIKTFLKPKVSIKIIILFLKKLF